MKNQTLCFLVVVCLNWASTLQGQILTNPNLPTFPGLGAATHAWGDYDSDGDQDLFLSGIDSTGTLQAWIMNNSNSSFSIDPTQAVVPMAYGNAKWADYDNDGDPDLAVTGSTGPGKGFTALYLNQGGTLLLSTQTLPQILGGDLEWADLDGDGDLDLLLSGVSPSDGNTGYIAVNQGNGNIILQERPLLFSLEAGDLATGDLNGDGLPDLVVTGSDARGEVACRILRNLGNFQFANYNHLVQGARHADLSLADIDSDGKDELLLQGIAGEPGLYIYELNSAGQIVKLPHNLVGMYRGSAEYFDFNNDGEMDLVSVGRGSSPMIPLVYEQSNGNFLPLGNSPNSVGLEIATLSVANIDTDPFLEILVSGRNANNNLLTYLLKYNPTTQQFEP